MFKYDNYMPTKLSACFMEPDLVTCQPLQCIYSKIDINSSARYSRGPTQSNRNRRAPNPRYRPFGALANQRQAAQKPDGDPPCS